MAKALKSDASAAPKVARGKLYQQLSPGELDVYIESFLDKSGGKPEEKPDVSALVTAKKAERKRAHHR